MEAELGRVKEELRKAQQGWERTKAALAEEVDSHNELAMEHHGMLRWDQSKEDYYEGVIQAALLEVEVRECVL